MAPTLLGSRAFLRPPILILTAPPAGAPRTFLPRSRRAERLNFDMSATESHPSVPARAASRTPNKTYVMTKAQAQGARAWWVVDAAGKPLGRLASEVAHVLRGKHKPQYTPHEDTGDFVIVVNADKVLLTGDEARQEVLLPPLGHPGRLPGRELPAPARARRRLPGREGRQGDAPQGRPRPRDAHQAQGLRDARPPARGAEARSPALSRAGQSSNRQA